MTPANIPQFFSSEPRILFIDMNSFFASVEQQEDPKCRNRPLAVAPMLSDSTCVISASYEARKYGIKTGTSVRDARRLCPNIRIVSAKHRNYVSYHYKLIDVLRHYFVEIRVLSVDEMACTLSPRQKRSGDFFTLAQKIKKQIYHDLGVCLRSSIGIGPNVFLAKVAADFQKPDGFTIFQGAYTDKLFQLELTDLPGIARRMSSRLAVHGIYTVEELWNASRLKLHAVWGGINGERWYFMLRGCLDTDYGIQGNEVRKSVSQSHVLPPKYRNAQGARDILFRLASKALKRLRSYNQAARSAAFWITFRHREIYQSKYSWNGAVTQGFYANDDLYWISAIEKEVSSLPDLPLHYPYKISIWFFDLVVWTHQQIGLFQDRRRYTHLFDVIDAINKDYGHRVDIASVYHLKTEAPFRIAFGNTLE